jgi:hypothetical protein
MAMFGNGAGLLGLGGFNLGGSQNEGMQGLLGGLYDPQEMRRQQIKSLLTNSGIAMLSQQPSKTPINFGTALGQGLAAGYEGAAQTGKEYQDDAMNAYKIKAAQVQMDFDRRRQEQADAWAQAQQERERAQWSAQDTMFSELPPQEQGLAQAFPEQYATQRLQKQFAPNGGAEYGLNPVWLQNPETGKYMLVQPSKAGGYRPMDMPEGYEPAPPNRTVDTGTGFTSIPTRGAPQAYPQEIPKNVAEEAALKEVGEGQGKARVAAPGDIAAADVALDLLGQIEADPYLERGTGMSSMGNVIPGTGGYDFQNTVNQATSGAFLTAIQQMRGLGSLSNAEGQTATAAVTRMNTASSEGAFKKALADYRRIVMLGRARAEARLGGGQPQQQQAPGGDLRSKYGLE